MLIVNACVNRDRSRTDRLAHAVSSFYKDHVVEELILEDIGLKPMDSQTLAKRDAFLKSGSFDDPMFDLAKIFRSVDVIILASPYWEQMFNSMLHIFIEHVSVIGLTFRYTDEGIPIGLCQADKLYYVTTRGGPITDEADMGFRIASSLSQFYGIGQCIPVSAQSLDIVGNDPEKIIDSTIDRLSDIVKP